MTEQLKPCPFCGKVPIAGRTHPMWDDQNNGGLYGITCQTSMCPTNTGLCHYNSMEEAHLKWNTRAPQEITEDVVNRLSIAVHKQISNKMDDGVLTEDRARIFLTLLVMYVDFKAALEAALNGKDE